MKFIYMLKVLTQKIGMTQYFDKEGNIKPSTLVSVLPSKVIRNKNIEKDGYIASLVGTLPNKKISKPVNNFLKKNKIEEKFSKYFEIKNEELGVGEIIDINSFSVDDNIIAIGISKGKGFSGTIKRHNFTTGPKSHGSHNYRQPGSIGSAYPQRVVKGKKMPGRMGSDRITVKGLKVNAVNKENGTMLISGAIPGPNKSYIYIIKLNDRSS